MAGQGKNKTDDFFQLLAEGQNQTKNQVIENPFAEDEILFKDEKGQIKVLKGDQVLDWKLAGESQVSVPIKPQRRVVSPTRVLVPVSKPASALRVSVGKPLNLDREVETIWQKSQLKFSDQEREKRFKNIILSRLKDIRDQIETREILLSSPLVGGMGFDAQTADRILQIINEEFERLDGKLRQAVSQEPFAELRAEAKKILTESPQSAPLLIFPTPEESAKESIQLKTGTETIKQKPFQPAEGFAPFKPIIQPTAFKKPVVKPTERPKIEDVKFRPRSLGPVEEIGSLTLTDFRRLAATPKEAAEKVLEKIKILEQESFSQFIAATKAWQQSEVYWLYLELGQQSMESKKPMTEIIAARSASQQPTLTEAEFEAVSDLNKKLRH